MTNASLLSLWGRRPAASLNRVSPVQHRAAQLPCRARASLRNLGISDGVCLTKLLPNDVRPRLSRQHWQEWRTWETASSQDPPSPRGSGCEMGGEFFKEESVATRLGCTFTARMVSPGGPHQMPTMGQVQQQAFISRSSGGWESEVTVLADLVEDPLPGLSTATYSPAFLLRTRGGERGRAACVSPSSYRSKSLSSLGPVPTTAFNCISFRKAPLQMDTVTAGARASPCEFCGD